MDENLFINIGDFIKHPLIREHRLNQPKLVEAIRSCPKFHYETKTGIIKFKEKADLNILIIRRFLKIPESDTERIQKEEFIKKLIRENNKSHVHRIKKIDKIGDGFHFVFEHEDVSQAVEKFLIERLQKEEGGRVLLLSIVQDESLINDFLQADICLAAESLKRRVVSAYESKPPSMWQQVQRINDILLNPVIHVPRRYTHNQKMNVNNKRQEYQPNNINRNSNMNMNSNFQSNYNINNHTPKKFDKNEGIVYSNSMVNTYDRDFIHSILCANLPTGASANASANASARNTNDLSVSPLRKSFNKFDLVELKKTFDDYHLPDGDNLKPHRNSDNVRKTQRVSYNPSIVKSFIRNSVFDKRRTSVFSNLSCEPVIEVHNTKEYDNHPVLERDDCDSSSEKGMNEGNLFEENLKMDLRKLTAFSYSNKEIVSVFFHMNFLKTFKTTPQELISNSPSEILREHPRASLETLRPKKMSIQKYIPRERSKTLYNQNDKKKSNLYYLISVLFLVSSASRVRASLESQQLGGDNYRNSASGMNGVYNRKRNTSSSVKVNKRHSKN